MLRFEYPSITREIDYIFEFRANAQRPDYNVCKMTGRTFEKWGSLRIRRMPRRYPLNIFAIFTPGMNEIRGKDK